MSSNADILLIERSAGDEGETERSDLPRFDARTRISQRVYSDKANSVSNLTSLRLNSVEFMTQFIKLYRSLPVLWKTKNEGDPKRYTKRQAAYRKMVELVRTLYKDADEKFVVAKIKSMRGCYNKELKKVQASHRTAAFQRDMYVPKLWYYELLSFAFDDHHERLSLKTDSVPEDVDSCGSDRDIDTQGSHRHVHLLPKPPKRRKKRTGATDATSETLVRDELESYFRSVTCKLKRMNDDQRLVVEKIINEALCLGALNRLTEFCYVETPVETREQYSAIDNYGQCILTYSEDLPSSCLH